MVWVGKPTLAPELVVERVKQERVNLKWQSKKDNLALILKAVIVAKVLSNLTQKLAVRLNQIKRSAQFVWLGILDLEG